MTYPWSLFLVWSCTHGDSLHPTVLHHILRDYSCWKTCLTSDYCMLSCALSPCGLLAIYIRMLHVKLYLNIFKNLFPIPLIQYNQSEIVEDHLLEMTCTWENFLLQNPKCITFQENDWYRVDKLTTISGMWKFHEYTRDQGILKTVSTKKYSLELHDTVRVTQLTTLHMNTYPI